VRDFSLAEEEEEEDRGCRSAGPTDALEEGKDTERRRGAASVIRGRSVGEVAPSHLYGHSICVCVCNV
jgi:hypothetical protein